MDLRRAGSRKLGGSNLMRQAGIAWGLAAGVLDGLKACAVIAATRALGCDVETQLACGLAAVAGQMWPVFFGFDGGRANATGWGFCVAADPLAAIAMAIPVAVALVLRGVVRPHPTRLLPIAAIASFAVWPAVIWEQQGPSPTVIAGLAVLALILIRRVTAGVRADLATGAPVARIIANRALFDRSELQRRGEVALS